VRAHLRAALEARHPVPVDGAEQLRDLARLLRIRRADALATPIRALSVRLFGDSKRLERLLPVADRLTRRAVGTTFSAEVGLGRAYPEASIALLGTLGFGGSADSGGAGDGSVRWRCCGDVVTLPAETIGRIARVEIDGADAVPEGPAPAALSVENKESFRALAARLRDGTLPGCFRAVVYCGGHPHRSYVGLLDLLARAGAELHHFGDLDPDGILIFAEMQKGLSAELRPFLMDAATYARYLPYGYEPPPARLELLASGRATLPPAIQPLAAAIVEHRLGIEQEVIDVNADANVDADGPDA
jgi:hypothetical protein